METLLHSSQTDGADLAELYHATALEHAAKAGAEVLSSHGALTNFERLCDDAVSRYGEKARLIPFGEAPVFGYLLAREVEYVNLRMILLGRNSNISHDIIRSRLRDCFV